MSETPRTDAFKLEAKSSLEVVSDNSWAKRLLTSHLELERENQQLREAVKVCAVALKTLHKFESETRIVYFYDEETEDDSLPFNLAEAYQESDMCDVATKVLSHPVVQAALKDK